MTTAKLLEVLSNTDWALHKPVFDQLIQIVERHASGVKLDADEVSEITAAGRQRNGRVVTAEDNRTRLFELLGDVAVIPLQGVIAKRASMVNGVSTPRGTSVERLEEAFEAALASDEVASILFDVDSPGGALPGVPEFAQRVFEARGEKPIVALADGQMMSAALWIGAQADRIVTTTGSLVGSIGVFNRVVDVSRAARNEGVEVEVVRSGQHKGMGTPGTPFTDADRAKLQEHVDNVGAMFNEAVARGRGLAVEDVQALADGSWWLGGEAVELGLADRLSTFSPLLRQMRGADEFGSGVEDVARVTTAGESQEVIEMQTKKTTTAPAATPAVDEAAVQSAATEAANTATEAERSRAARILGAAHATQGALARDLVSQGASVEEALEELNTDLSERYDALEGQAATIAERRTDEPAGDGGGNPEAAAPRSGATDTLEKMRAEFDANPRLAQLHGDFEGYLAFGQACANGQVRNAKRGDD